MTFPSDNAMVPGKIHQITATAGLNRAPKSIGIRMGLETSQRDAQERREQEDLTRNQAGEFGRTAVQRSSRARKERDRRSLRNLPDGLRNDDADRIEAYLRRAEK